MIDYRAPLDELPDPLPIKPLQKPFDVTIRPPGSKSITNRAYMLAALAKGESKIIRPLRSEDTDALLIALCTLGAEARWAPGKDGDDVFIKGVAGRFPRGGSVNLGDGGTPTRFMIAAACLAAEPVVVDGSPRMRERPIAEGVEMLRQLGATIEYVEEEGRLPVRVVPSEDFQGGEIEVGRTQSSQFVSALLLIGSFLARGIAIRFIEPQTSASYISLTCDQISSWGGQVESDQHIYAVKHQILLSCEDVIQPDASSATYFITAGAMCKHSVLCIFGLTDFPCQPDYDFTEVVAAMGADVDTKVESIIIRAAKALRSIERSMNSMPDASMSLAVSCAVADGPSSITGLHTLRVKETDRIAALANELRKVGCTVETTDDSITITPPAQSHGLEARSTKPIVIETYNDHRMAMSFAILGLVHPGIAIANPKCVAKSYPTFWHDFATLYD